MSLDMTKIITEDDKIELDFPTVRNQHQFPQSEEQRIKLFDQLDLLLPFDTLYRK